ncbi:hypothetical protein ASG21_19770 [Chryseobacterium sp. Leaf394]|nr:hypothetical protein ASG21_19770 [Chryseobacterium sp. Leaf394]
MFLHFPVEKYFINFNKTLTMREFTEKDHIELAQKIEEFKAQNFQTIKQPHITIGYQGDIESTNYANQIANRLTENGNNIESIILFSSGNADDHYSISAAPDNSILVEIFAEK